MQTVSLEEAQARLPELIAGVRSGEEVVLTEQQRPVAKIVALPPEQPHVEPRPIFGCLKGQIVEREDCWEPETEMWKDYMP